MHPWLCRLSMVRRLQKIQKEKNEKQSSRKKVVTKTKSKRKTLCKICQKNPLTVGARGKCVFCAQKMGYKFCKKCGKMFIPKPPTAKHCGCKSKGRGSVWIVASAGLPSLGRKRWKLWAAKWIGMLTIAKNGSGAGFAPLQNFRRTPSKK